MGPKIKNLKAQGLNQRQAVEKLLSQSAKCSDLLTHMKSAAFKLPKKHIEETYTCGGKSGGSSGGNAPTPPKPQPTDDEPSHGHDEPSHGHGSEAACENKGFGYHECYQVSGCHWDDGQCWAR